MKNCITAFAFSSLLLLSAPVFADDAKPVIVPIAETASIPVNPPAPGAAIPPAPTPARVTVGDITDSRTTGQFFAGMKVDFKLSGDAVFDAYGIGRPVFLVAKDDTGRSLVKDEKPETLLWDLNMVHGKSSNESATGELANPSRKAGTVTLQGYIPVYSPTLDPSAVVSLPSIAAVYGKTMESKQTEISLTVLDKASVEAFNKTKAAEQKAKPAAGGIVGAAIGQAFGIGINMRENDVQFRVKDPHAHLVRFEVTGADGKAIDNNGRSKTSNNGEDVYTFSFNSALPKDAGLKIYYATTKSMQNVPFDFQNVALP